MQFNAMKSMQCHAMHCKSCRAVFGGDAGGCAHHGAFYACEMHDLTKCIQAIMLRNANVY